jgi:hypothetical protein
VAQVLAGLPIYRELPLSLFGQIHKRDGVAVLNGLDVGCHGGGHQTPSQKRQECRC